MRVNTSHDQLLKLYHLSKTNMNLTSLNKGDVIQGEILDIKQNAVLIKLMDGQSIHAKLSEQMEFLIGEKVIFEVKAASDEQIELKPIMEQDYNPKTSKLLQVLNQAGISINEKNIQLVDVLMKNQMPIDKGFIHKVLMFSNQFKDASIEHILLLMKNDIPVNQNNLNQLAKFINSNQNMGDDMSQLVKELMSDSSSELKDQLKSIIIGDKDFVAEDKLSSNAFEKLVSKDDLSFLETKINQQLKPLGHKISLNDASTLKEINNMLEMMEVPDKLRTNIKHIISNKLTENVLKNELLMPLDTLENSESISKFFNKTYKKILTMLETLSSFPEQEGMNVTKHATSIKNSLEFNHTLNQNYNFVQLPIQINNKAIDSQLYVFQNKNGLNKKNQKNRVTALLRLDLAALGHLDIYVAKQDKNIECKFYVENKRFKTFFDQHMSKLYNTFKDTGYQIQELSVSLSEKEFDPVKDFLDKDSSLEHEVKRYSFDMRV